MNTEVKMNDVLNQRRIFRENSEMISTPDYIKEISREAENSLKKHYYVKDEMDRLIGPANFSEKLEQVNYIIGIFVSLLLVAYILL